MEEATITSKGQIVVPARLSRESIRSVHGLLTSKTSVTKELLRERTKDREHEEAKIEKRRPR